jgi:hypothetical protein
MQEQELIQTIREYIKTWYKADYIGLLTVEKLNPGYKFSIGIPSYMTPTTLNIDCETDEEFLDFIYAELRSRNYMRLDIYKVIRTNDSKEE